MKEEDKSSYLSASAIPIKILLNSGLIEACQHGRIPPIHLQIYPTNRCNLQCTYCSFSERDRDAKMDLDSIKEVIVICKSLGTKAVTITGGGEPLCYERLDEIVDFIFSQNIKVALTTNGLLLPKVPIKMLRQLTWCRISHDSERSFNQSYRDKLGVVITNCQNVDWAFSYVVTTGGNYGSFREVVEFANNYHLTHVRVIEDLLSLEDVSLNIVCEVLDGIDDSRVIYQGRKSYTKGQDCYICYLKPVIDADLRVYPCCGVQYAQSMPSRKVNPDFSMGMATDMRKIMSRSNMPFDGSRCERCYYNEYNVVLANLLSEVKHKEFV